MANESTLFNNEALACLMIGHYVSKYDRVDNARILLILPFAFHEGTTRKLRNQSKKRSLDEFILNNVDTLSSFNHRFQEFIPLSINALCMLYQMGVVSLQKETTSFNGRKTSFQPRSADGIGDRAKKLLEAVDHLAPILEGDIVNIYLKLKIIL